MCIWFAGIGGAGGIFRDSRGLARGSFAVHLNSTFAFEAELWAATVAIFKAQEFKWRNLWLESDSTFVVNLLKNRSDKVPWRLQSRWLTCLDFVNSINFQISHKFREGNKAADALANYGAQHPGSHWWSTNPSFVSEFINDDSCNRENFRFG